ncbi:AcrR family transcriptional regulator [Mycolicibacterium sp. BK556]|uniref:TetR/AcrR family transcriptional regulator n=1 Tax=unclassified Mycolicibacterium TaxID=2636767 RepID=UPI0016213175|nr:MULTISPECIES: TetR/AcrR family transcriptional regulator [unclassified Mycolicibacterium]MBB3600572.1 AcrR family transcriptional regulator [Mycolicibacterium sp. BK556]MBB3630325.1 AcrR family transcriptional regulator [Mycolicibacterium sp. BK607]MBB3748324.1 AcrR family transcriptional regulator [Mycolicibacterium sp. BK634]
MAAMLAENHDPVLLSRVVAAARRCFARFGVDRTTMHDIAKEAGIGRTGVYRLGLTRPEITEAAIVGRLQELGEGIRPIAARDASFAELLVETSIATVDAARSDPELHHLLDTTTTVSLHRLITGHDSAMQAIVADVLGPMLRRGREQGELRPDVSDERVVEWLRGVYLMLMLREDLDAEAERAMVADFVLSSLVVNKKGTSG